MAETRRFKVANLDNLFWDNGSFLYPNTYPKLINGEYKNKTPIFTSPTTGWVILEGEYNYCQFDDNLFFLKKAGVVSHKRNKWIYILVKDHICSLFKNKSNIVARGTLINTDIDNLREQDFQFIFPVFNNYSKRVLIPLLSEPFNWRKHGKREKITKVFDSYSPITDKDYSEFIATLEANKDLFTKAPVRQWTEVVKKNKYLVLLGRLRSQDSKVTGWKNELVTKINNFLDEIPHTEDIVFGTISNSSITNATKINGKCAISYTTGNTLFTNSKESREIDIDLSGLTDIELINFDNVSLNEKYSVDHFNLFLGYDINKVGPEFRDIENTFVYKLSRRIRIPFASEYSSRAIKKNGGKHYPFSWNPNTPQISLCYPQKVFFKATHQLTLKGTLEDTYLSYPRQRDTDNYRSVYLYWCFNLDFYFAWGRTIEGGVTSFASTHKTWIKNTDYFKEEEKQNILRVASGDRYFKATNEKAIAVIPNTQETDVELNRYPWGKDRLTSPINIGWLLGQFSIFLTGQDKYFESWFPYIVKTAAQKGTTLKRLKGLQDTVSKLVSLGDLYEESSHTRETTFTLDCFNPLSRRMQEITPEEDFLIGEKLLFTTWGMAPYLLFQPACFAYDRISSVWDATVWLHWGFGYLSAKTEAYGYYNWEDLDDYYNPQLFGKWIGYASWHYPAVVFDSGAGGSGYWSQWAKQWYKQAYSNYESLKYDTFFETNQKYQQLQTHITKNTEAYFITEDIDFSTNPIQELKVNDIFYSDLEWFWFNAGSATEFTAPIPSDYITHAPALIGEDTGSEEQRRVQPELSDGEIIAYLNPKDSKIYLGRVHVWNDAMNLPPNQYITDNPSDYSSNKNFVNITYTRITPLDTKYLSQGQEGFESIDVLIDTLKRARYMKKTEPKDLQELQDTQRTYLFNLKGTPFFCSLDRLGRVSLIFKNKERYREEEHIPD